MNTDKIIQYENGELDLNDTLELFSDLVKSGSAWTLQGHYGRTAHHLIRNDILDHQGNINWSKVEEM